MVLTPILRMNHQSLMVRHLRTRQPAHVSADRGKRRYPSTRDFANDLPDFGHFTVAGRITDDVWPPHF
jgi:hypothetical protein